MALQSPPAIQESPCHLSRVILWPNPPLISQQASTTAVCLAVSETVMTARAQMRLRLVTLCPVVNHSTPYKVSCYPSGVFFLPMHVQQRVKNARFGRDKMRPQYLDQQEGQFSQGDHTRDKIRHRVRQMLSDSPTEENRALIIKGKRKICEFRILLHLLLAVNMFFSRTSLEMSG